MKRLTFRAVCFAAGLLAVTAGGSLGAAVARPDAWTFSLPATDDGPAAASRLLTGVDFGANTDLGRFDMFDAAGSHGYDGLFLSATALQTSFDLRTASLTGGGAFVSETIALADDLHFNFGAASSSSVRYEAPNGIFATVTPFDARGANSLLAGVSWNFARWGGIGLTASQTNARNGLIGIGSGNAETADTTALDVSARMGLGGGWVTTASFSQGITKLDLKTGFVAPDEDVSIRSYGIAVAKHGLFGNDALGVAVSRPGPNASGFATIDGASGPMQFFGRDHLLDGQTPETDIELGYVTTFLDGAVALQANADYQMNFAGQNGTNAVSLLSRAKIKF